MTTILLALPLIVGAATLISDSFGDGKSDNQDLANNSIRIFKGRSDTVRIDAPGSVTFDINTTSSEAFWGYFTNAGSPVGLNVGDKLAVSGTFSLSGFVGGDVRFGLFDSLGTRNTADLTGGQNQATFAGDTGYAVQFNTSGTGAPFGLYRRTNLTGNNPFNTLADFTQLTGTGATVRQTLANDTPYTLTYTVERLSATDTRVTFKVSGGALPADYSYTAVETSNTPNTTFDYFVFRVGGTGFTDKIKFTNWLIDYTPSLPVITSQPQPSNLTVQVGSNVTTSVAASGNALSYQWRKNGAPIAGNPSASTQTLNLTNVQLSDAGSYTAVVSNPGGSVTSNPVMLNVSTDPVPPPPSITTQPADAMPAIGTPGSLSVAATGDNLFYQWFKNGALIPGATQSTLHFASAQVADSGTYHVVVSNSSGSVTSTQAKLLVVSTMLPTSFAPSNFASGVDIDSPLYLTFNKEAKVGTTGRLRVYKEDGTIVDTIDMSAATQSRLNGTVSFNYRPVIATGETVAIYLHQKLAYNQSYYVTMEPGVITDAAGAPFVGISDASVWNFSTKTSGPAAGTTFLTVAANGTGDFATVQGAVDFVPANNTKRVVIFVKKGTYTEIVYVNSNKPFITVRGEDRNLSVIQYANNNNFNPTSTTHRAMFGVDAPDFTLENITLRNTTPQGGSQAEAFRGNNNRIVLNRVSLYSYQDTLLLQGQSNQGGFVTDSYIEGDVDFMWGSGAVFFQNSEFKMLRSDAFYTQIRNGAGRNGYVYVNCKFTRQSNSITGSYLTRIDPDDFPHSQVVIINSQMDGVRPDPWRFDNPGLAVTSANYPNIRFWEYNTRDLNGNPVDVSQRHPISRQLTAAEAAQWSDPTFVLGGWVTQTKLTAAVTLSNLTQNFSGAPAVATVTTEPAGLPVTVTYNGSAQPPTAIGTYTVVATINDANYQGTATGTLVVDRTPVAVTLSNLAHTFDGTPKSATVSTNPAGPVVSVTYNGSATPPAAVGTYSVVASINDANYRGGTSATMTIYAPGTQPLVAFPGAEGAGANARGGRGGDVYHVTNLNDSGAGSLREAVRSATGPRTIVFDVAGTIYLNSRLNVNKSNLTMAGQTAPGDGITVAGWPTVISASNVIIRYMRFRMGDLNCPAVQDDALWVDKSTDVILDHVSASWSVDETLSVTESNRVTVQWSFITESMKNSCHEKGAHGYGSLIRYGTGIVTYHHNLYAHHDSRNPRLGDSVGLDFVNNVVYDWGGEAGYSGPDSEGGPRLNYVGNYLVAGPMTTAAKLRAFNGGGVNTQIYQSNNFLDGDKDGTRDGSDNGWAMFIGSYTKREPARFDYPQVTTHDAQTAYERVLKTAGQSLKRDSVDERIVGEVKAEGGRHINTQNEVGGYPVLNPATAPADTDGDGIPDEWESNHGLNPADPADGRAITSSGYSNLERYLNDLVPVSGTDSSADLSGPSSLATLSQEANAAGWHNNDLNVTITATDNNGGSGVHEIIYSVNGTTHHEHSPLAIVPVTSEGVTTITYFAKDEAGNSEEVRTLTIKLDKTAPVIGEVTRTPANAGGWNNSDVTASYSATDALSGFEAGSTATGSTTFDTEGANQSFTFEVADLAGNVAKRTISDVNIDKTAPVIDATRTPANANGWNNSDVTASYSATDALSGLAAGTPATGTHLFNSEGANQSQSFEVADLAGNVASTTVSGVNIDKTAPAIEATRTTPANAQGWNNTDVVVGYSASDALSGLASPASGERTFTEEGAGQAQTFEVADLAGNTASATVSNVNIDKTAPVINVAQPIEGGFYILNQPAQADYTCSDNLSGADCVGTVANHGQFNTALLGGKSFTVNSTDKAGNTVQKTVNYTVGFNLNPLYDPNQVNKSGSTIPVKLQLIDSAGVNLSSATTVVRAVGVSLITSETYGPVSDPGNSNPDGNFRYVDGSYQFNLKTTGFAPGTYRLYFTVGTDPYVYTTQFQVR